MRDKIRDQTLQLRRLFNDFEYIQKKNLALQQMALFN